MRSIALVILAAALSLGAPALAGPKGCPPGLAKKAVPCVPPGQAKAWHLGGRLPGDRVWPVLEDWQRYGLPAPTEGSRYVLVDEDILLVAIATGIILDYLGAF
jgi:hypothetical protein